MKLTREDSLKAKPVRNQKLLWEKDEKGNVLIYIPRRKTAWTHLFSFIFSESGKKTIILDEIGSKVWEMCDGEKTVEEIISFFCKEYKLNLREAEVSIFAYFKKLAEKRLIGLMMTKEEKNARNI
ncbi:hypothetical protein AUJ66_08290 [Candidatus Desantisbacteria bacterium CG1_02_38_46]|uniref:PqqD family protein n=3 Tax=unclassified Candidatus Desantisiibacteriota TaxID=3106372 RepID=A0A2H9PDQ3_9BACT|nr:MAG: hypothetical protein AUJ66_08290 [Candidatus Desantisbacteria bacterium CG1_02_38_46]PIU50908.1 MAG: hypothetical protein COS91_07280 [Candidatus Desantisbacteria bacterium CG07_land_8_20_14_0_80_39_15]PIZ16620.1 MAG: hypothetical protein COY51_02200 [Candidatus Desantisbacteria bacterium CG_4_10_14_0_8_um_filter_39_17]